MNLPTWSISGVLMEARELRTSKDNKIFAYVLKVAAMGGTYELQTRDPNIFNAHGAGTQVNCTGTFEQYNGQLRLSVVTVQDAAKTKGAA